MGLQAGGQPAAIPTGRRVRWWQIFSWQLYDFADTIYSMNVTSLYFGRWIIRAFGATDLHYTLLSALANLAVAVTSPLFGAISDAQGRRLPYLRTFALLCAAATALLGWAPSLAWAGALFALSYVAYTVAGNNFYQALLPGISTPENVSRVSGIGVALGYAGALVGMYAVQPFVPTDDHMARAFLPTAALYLIFALPCLTLVPDITDSRQPARLDLAAGYRRLAATFREARRHRHLFRFLVADFLYENAVAAVIAQMAVYTEIVAGMDSGAIRLLLGVSIAVAVPFACLYGWITDRTGPRPALLGMLAIWCATFALVLAAREPGHFFAVGPLAGMGLGATWVASRTMLVALAPVEKSGEFFGLYSLSGKSASVAGLAVWYLVGALTRPYLGQAGSLRAAAGSMLAFVALGALLCLGLPRCRPTPANCICAGGAPPAPPGAAPPGAQGGQDTNPAQSRRPVPRRRARTHRRP